MNAPLFTGKIRFQPKSDSFTSFLSLFIVAENSQISYTRKFS
jgi:hypothetical protein